MSFTGEMHDRPRLSGFIPIPGHAESPVGLVRSVWVPSSWPARVRGRPCPWAAAGRRGHHFELGQLAASAGRWLAGLCPASAGAAGRMNMTFVSVNGTQSGRGGGQRGAAGLVLYRRVCIAFGNSARQPGRQSVPAAADIAEMKPIRNAPETYPGRRDNTEIMPLSCDDVRLHRRSGAAD